MNLNTIKQMGAGNLPMPPTVERSTALALGATSPASPFGCCDFFDSCADEIITLSYSGTLDLLDWMGFAPTEDCYRSVEFINYNRPEQSGGTCTGGYISDPCADPESYEIGSCSITVEDFGLIGRKGPVRKLNNPKRYCKTRPRYRLDGTVVASEVEWDMLFAADVMIGDVKRQTISGNSLTAGQFDGLQQWVATGYECEMLDSVVIDWGGNSMAGGAGITWNGVAQPAGFNLVDALLAVHRHIQQRISWTQFLRSGADNMNFVNMIIVAPTFLIRCLLDEYACWSVCPGVQYEEIFKHWKELRDFRLQLDGGVFGHGQIALDGHTIPLLAYDWDGMISSQNVGDMYLLTGSVGPTRIWEGEFLDASMALSEVGDILGGSFDDYWDTDGGRILGKFDNTNLCYEVKMWTMLRLFCLAPWMQARFQDVACSHFGPTLSPDPCETCFFPESCFTPATCTN